MLVSRTLKTGSAHTPRPCALGPSAGIPAPRLRTLAHCCLRGDAVVHGAFPTLFPWATAFAFCLVLEVGSRHQKLWAQKRLPSSLQRANLSTQLLSSRASHRDGSCLEPFCGSFRPRAKVPACRYNYIIATNQEPPLHVKPCVQTGRQMGLLWAALTDSRRDALNDAQNLNLPQWL